ncbi:hypothetical protein C9J48_00775 [Photobacterium profundum]|nr:hypothetical protein C9J48_00775 [Photobacterium profundum]
MYTLEQTKPNLSQIDLSMAQWLITRINNGIFIVSLLTSRMAHAAVFSRTFYYVGKVSRAIVAP